MQTLQAGRASTSRRCRQLDFQHCTATGPISRAGLSVVGVGYGTNYAQAKATAPGLARARRLASPEALKGSLGSARWEASSAVEHT